VILPRTSPDIANTGHYDTPLESLEITGHYLAGYPLGITYAIMDGVNQISIITLADQLLSEEVLELDEDGILTSTYTDDFATSTRWTTMLRNPGQSYQAERLLYPLAIFCIDLEGLGHAYRI